MQCNLILLRPGCRGWVYLLAGMLFHLSCDTGTDIPNEPRIWFISFSKSEMNQGDINQDSVWMEIGFEDGDGDLGFGSSSPEKDIFLFDTRTSLLQDAYKLPDLPPTSGKSISGTIRLRIYNTCCLFPLGIPPCSTPSQFPKDSISYEFYMVDRAGNQSGRVKSPNLYLNCR